MSDEKKKAEQVFVIQRQHAHTPAEGVARYSWEDIATVTIPANVPRRIALKRALKDAGLTPGKDPVKLRALDAKSAEVHEPEAHQPPLEWKL